MRLHYLGTSAARPSEERGLSCACLERDGEVLMFDAGEGTQYAYLKSGLGWNKPMSLFVTHMHGDHCLGLIGMLQTMGMRDRSRQLEIYGPEGIKEFVASNAEILSYEPPFPVIITEIEEGVVCKNRGYTVSACEAEHAIKAYSYRVSEDQRPGEFDEEKARRLGVPEGPLWAELQDGSDVTINGKKIESRQVVGEPRPGRRIGFSGDTRPTKKLLEFFAGCDYLTFDSTFLYDMRDNALRTGHTTAREAAVFAKEAGVKNLVLTHFSARYTDESVMTDEASGFHDSVIAASDGMEITV